MSPSRKIEAITLNSITFFLVNMAAMDCTLRFIPVYNLHFHPDHKPERNKPWDYVN